ncbi:hypothetical protein [Kushneria phosphatilytica]|uniref:hypothetical protein n=1 Tax=Kushneria phosphatilytica TaxID=657387 RepID=UPI0008DA74E5|nr:hypothetical protein [Kushneria phosphatilytica]OHV08777.1 hypothetical protein BH688_12225 [Kushneria phosphatilytica]
MLAIIPLVLLGYSWEQYDFIFHFTSWQEYGQSMAQGNLLPIWSSLANFGLGEPRYLFYPPLSLMVGGVLSWVLPPVLLPGAMIWLLTGVCALTTWHLTPASLDRSRRQVVALLVALGFGMLNSGIVRYAMAEMMASALIPLLLSCFVTMRQRADIHGVLRFAGMAALMWLTNMPMAIASTYLLGAVTLYCCLRDSSLTLLKHYLMGYVLSVLAIAWYLVPAILAESTISPSAVGPTGFSHMTLLDVPSLIGRNMLALVISSVAMVVFLLALGLRRRQLDQRLEIMAALGVVAIVVQLPGAVWLFGQLPVADMVGFWFRFYFFVSLTLPVVAFTLFRSRLLHGFIVLAYVMFYAGVGLLNFQASHHDGAGNPDLHAPTTEVLSRHEQGFAGYPEYLNPHTESRVIEHASQRPAWDIRASEGCHARVTSMIHGVLEATTRGETQCSYTLARYAFPFWHLYIDGQRIAYGHNGQGLLTVDVAAGEHRLMARVVRPLWPTLLGWGISLIVLLILVPWLIRRQHSVGHE